MSHDDSARPPKLDSNAIRLLSSVFEDAWRCVQVQRLRSAADAGTDRDTLAKAILAAAKSGERNGEKLRDLALGLFVSDGLRRRLPQRTILEPCS
jgi:hypothetical protein